MPKPVCMAAVWQFREIRVKDPEYAHWFVGNKDHLRDPDSVTLQFRAIRSRGNNEINEFSVRVELSRINDPDFEAVLSWKGVQEDWPEGAEKQVNLITHE